MCIPEGFPALFFTWKISNINKSAETNIIKHGYVLSLDLTMIKINRKYEKEIKGIKKEPNRTYRTENYITQRK